ncbi:MAG: hypothetical protein ACE5DO_09360 [Desulfobacterales bacterium]
MLKAEGKINDAIIENMMNWRRSGFNPNDYWLQQPAFIIQVTVEIYA